MSDDEKFKAASAQLTAAAVPPVPQVDLKAMPSPAGTPPEARFGERLRDARQQLGLSVEALSRLTKGYDLAAGKGVSPPTLGRYESGDTLPTLRELRLLAEALDVPAQWLVDGNSPYVKGSAEAQALISAISKFVTVVQNDVMISGSTLSETIEWHRANKRAELLSEARKPAASD